MRVLDLLPRRTPLLPIEPIDQYSPTREALTSYFRRLCAVNGLRVSRVFSALILPRLAGVSSLRKRRGHPAYDYRFVNSGGKPASEWVAALEQLTGMGNLRRLTLLDWNGTLAQPHVLTDYHRKWCPACYQDALDSGNIIYDQLAWAIRGFDYCPVHSASLEKKCPHCHKGPFFPLTGNDVAGFCPQCHKWLGFYTLAQHDKQGAQDGFSLWTARSIMTILNGRDELGSASDYSPDKIIHKLIDQHFNGSAAAFGALLERPKSVTCGWRKGKFFPKWDAWCQISYCFSVPLQNLITGNFDPANLPPPRTLPQTRTSTRRKPKRRQWDRIGRFLNNILQEEPPRFSSLTAIAQRLGMHVRLLTRRFPRECASLSKRFTAKRRIESVLAHKKGRRILKAAVHEAIDLLRRNGQHPTRRNIEQLLSIRKIKYRSKYHLLPQCIQSVENESWKPAGKSNVV